MITKQEYEEARTKRDAAEVVMDAFHKQEADSANARWERFNKRNEYYVDAELRYSATARCDKCGAGMAYPLECPTNHQWTCSNVLKGIGTDKGHTALPFAFYEVKSEDQPSANGATTRPKEPIELTT